MTAVAQRSGSDLGPRSRGPHGGPTLIPPVALSQWLALAVALRDRGPAPCERGPLEADAWWSTAPATVELARLACRMCPVRAECAAYALAAREREGVWAGLTPEDRASVEGGQR